MRFNGVGGWVGGWKKGERADSFSVSVEQTIGEREREKSARLRSTCLVYGCMNVVVGKRGERMK